MRKKTRKVCMSFLLAFVMIVGLVFSAADVDAATHSKGKSPKVLVVYFSGTGTTKKAAKKIKKATGGKLYRIKAAVPYTSADLDYSNDDCRANIEQQDESTRPEIKGKVKKIRKYDVIFIGYPIWWGKEPMIIRTFLESYNLKGKTIVPFCTSGGSGISGSMKGVKTAAKDANVLAGKDLTDKSYRNVEKWAKKKIK